MFMNQLRKVSLYALYAIWQNQTQIKNKLETNL